MPSLELFNAYVLALAYHDWFYDYSDDHSVWRAGRDKEETLRNKTKEHSFYETAYSTWSASVHGRTVTAAERNAVIDVLRHSITEEAYA